MDIFLYYFFIFHFYIYLVNKQNSGLSDFAEDPFKDYRYEDPFSIQDPFADNQGNLQLHYYLQFGRTKPNENQE